MTATKSEEVIDWSTVMHPLENTWCFWYFTNENKKNWLENLKELTNFDTVEEYWRLHKYMKEPSELTVGRDYCVFKRGVSPTWEDAANRAGGRWLLTLERRAALDLNNYWLDLVLLMIGENFQYNEAVSGAVVNVRPKSKIALWTKTTDEKVNMAIGKKIKKELKTNIKLQYMVHENGKVLYSC